MLFLSKWTWTRIISLFCSLVCDIEMLCATFVVILLSGEVALLTSALSKCKITAIKFVSEEDYNLFKSKVGLLYETLQTIFEAFALTVTVFEIAVVLYVARILMNNLLSLGITIILLKGTKQEYDRGINYSVGFVSWLVKGMLINVLLSVSCDKFYRRVAEVQAVCEALLQEPTDVALRRTAKNMIRLCSVRHEIFRACGLFVVDAALPLRLAGLVTTYCIMLLQFVFL